MRNKQKIEELDKYDIFTTYTKKWQNQYSINWLPWNIIECKKWKTVLKYKIENWYIILDEIPKRKYKLSVTVEF